MYTFEILLKLENRKRLTQAHTGWLEEYGVYGVTGVAMHVAGDQCIIPVVKVTRHFERQSTLDHSVASKRHVVIDDVILDHWQSVLKPRDVWQRISVDNIANTPMKRID